jgi:hypothetical protein
LKHKNIIYFISGITFGYLAWYFLLNIYKLNPNSEAIFNQHIVKTKTNLLSKIESPRLVIFSGSNSMYGFNAKKIEQELGISTVNCGIHAGLSLDFLLWLTEHHFSSGDTIIMPLEYNLYNYDPYKLTRTQVNIVHGFYPKYLDQLPMVQRIKFYLS